MPTARTLRIVVLLTTALWVLSAVLSVILIFAEAQLEHHNVPLTIITTVIVAAISGCIAWVWVLPQDTVTLRKLHFKVPLVPLLPMITICINVFLMVRLSRLTWIRFSVWMILGEFFTPQRCSLAVKIRNS